jgi:hypothetical protein
MLEEYASVSLDAGVRFQFGTGSIRAHIQDQTVLSNLEIQRTRIPSLKRRMVRMLDDIVESVIWLSIDLKIVRRTLATIVAEGRARTRI